MESHLRYMRMIPVERRLFELEQAIGQRAGEIGLHLHKCRRTKHTPRFDTYALLDAETFQSVLGRCVGQGVSLERIVKFLERSKRPTIE